jgi:hypothetical protein
MAESPCRGCASLANLRTAAAAAAFEGAWASGPSIGCHRLSHFAVTVSIKKKKKKKKN